MRWSIPRREWTHSHRGTGAHPHSLGWVEPLTSEYWPYTRIHTCHCVLVESLPLCNVMYNVLSVLAIFIDVMDLLASSINLPTWSPSVIWRTKWFLKSWKTRMWTYFLLIDGTNYETSKNNCKKTLIKPPSPLNAGPPPVWKIILRTTPFIFI